MDFNGCQTPGYGILCRHNIASDYGFLQVHTLSLSPGIKQATVYLCKECHNDRYSAIISFMGRRDGYIHLTQIQHQGSNLSHRVVELIKGSQCKNWLRTKPPPKRLGALLHYHLAAGGLNSRGNQNLNAWLSLLLKETHKHNCGKHGYASASSQPTYTGLSPSAQFGKASD